MTQRIRVALIEDDAEFRGALRLGLTGMENIDLAGVYATGRAALRGLAAHPPDLAVIDLGLPDISGVTVIRDTRMRRNTVDFLVLSAYDDDEHLFAALKAGAVGYIVKTEADMPGIAAAIHEARAGGAPMSAGLARRVLQEFHQIPSPAMAETTSLSTRERDVLHLLQQGFPSRAIAGKLCIAYETVRARQKAIYRKLQVHSATELLARGHGTCR